jgi:hypothetical protein
MSEKPEKVYFKDWFVPSRDQLGIQRARAFCKWWLEFVRNIGVVALLGIFADRADNWAVTLLSTVSLGALSYSAASYAHEWFLNPFPRKAEQSWLWAAIALAITVLIATVVWLSIASVIGISIREIARIQAGKF